LTTECNTVAQMSITLKPMYVVEAVIFLACTWLLGVCYGMKTTMKEYESRITAIRREIDDVDYRTEEAKRTCEVLGSRTH